LAFGTPYLIGHNTPSTGTSQTIAVGTATTAGDAIIVATGNSSTSTTVTSVTDSKSNTYTAAIAAVTSSEFGHEWIALNTTALTTSDTITITYSTTTGQKGCVAIGCSGVATSSAIDQAVSAHATSSSPSATTGTLSQATEMAIGVIFNKSTGGAPTGLGSFTSITQFQSGSSPEVTVAYLATSATTAVTFSGTITSDNWCDIVITLLPASGGAGSVTGVVASVALAAPVGSVSAGGTVTGVVAPLALAAPIGTATVGKLVAGVTATTALAAPSGSVSAGATVSGVIASLALSAIPGLPSAPTPNAGTVVNVWEDWTSGSYTYAKDGPGAEVTSITLTPDNSFLAVGTGVPTAGNWLFAISSWQSSQDQAVMHAVDDQHNFWQEISVSGTGKVRLAILLVQNAKAPSYINFSSSAFVRDATYTIVEVSGLNAGFILDSVATNTAASGTSIATSQAISQADFVLSASVFNSVLGNINTTTGSTSISPITNALTQMAAVWKNTSATPFAETFSSSTSTSAAWGAVSVAVAAGAPLPVNSNTAWPVIQCQAAFGATPGDPSAYWTWTDITPRFLGIKGQRGRQFELDQLVASDVTISLDNVDGALNPFNSSSPFYPNVKLMTPIRLLATWQGRTYQVFSGFYQYLPQTYDFQRGMVEAQATDSFAKLPQVFLQNCMEQEILFDQPWSYWTLGDTQGALAASNASGRSADLLNVVTSRYGLGPTTATFGNTPVPPMAGANGVAGSQTVWTQTGVTFRTSGPYGTCLQVIDQAFPSVANGVTVEIWANLTGPAGGLLLSLEDLMHPGLPQGLNGNIIAVYANDPGDGTNPGISLDWADSGGTAHNLVAYATRIALNRWFHVVLQITSTTYAVYFQGAKIASGSWTLWSSTIDLLSAMGQQDKFNQLGNGPLATNWPDASYGFINGSAAHLAVHDRIIDPERILMHYNSGVNGFAGETTGTRISRLLSYSNWGGAQGIDLGLAKMQALNYLGQGGYGSAGIGGSQGIFGAYGFSSNTGTAVDQAVVDTAASENGLIYVDHNGALVFKQRSNVYNGPLRGAFGDGFVPLNKNTDFANGLAPWASFPAGASLSLDGATWVFSGQHSAVLGTNGSTANPQAGSENTIPVTVGSTYTATAWVYSPQGCTASIGMNWWSGGSVIGGAYPAGVVIPPSTPMKITATGPVIATTTGAQIFVQMNGTPPATTTLYFDRVTLSGTGMQVSYEDDIVINYDVTYLYNDVTITRNVDQVIARLVNKPSHDSYFPRVYSRTIYTQTQNPPADLTDCANWLLNAYAQPAFRIEQMTIDVASNPDAWELVLGLDVGDLVSFQRSALGQPVIVQNFIIISVEPDMTQDTATFAYAMAPVLSPVLTLGDPVYGLLGPNALGW
jgi:hypothetical protein